MAHTDVYHAQVVANEANKEIAREANEWNYRMFQEQNDWNYMMWDAQNKYNEPKQQVERYLQAGINPLWAMKSGDAGQAQQLTSATPSPYERAEIMPEYDSMNPARIGNIVTAAQNVSNSLQGFMKLGLEAQDVQTRQRAQTSQAALNLAEGMYKKAQTQSQELFNNLNARTFETQVSTKVAEYDRLKAEIAKAGADTAVAEATKRNLNATHDQIIAQTKYVNAQSDALIEQVKQGWKRLAIEQQQADTSQYSAYSQSYYQGEQLKQNERQFQFSMQKAVSDFELQSNSQIVDWIDKQRGAWEKAVGYTSKDGSNFNMDVLTKLQAAGRVLSERLQQEPSPANVQSYNEWLQAVDGLPLPPSLPVGTSPSTVSVLNP